MKKLLSIAASLWMVFWPAPLQKAYPSQADLQYGIKASPDTPPLVRNAMDEECTGSGFNVPNAIWTWTAQGSTTETQANGWCSLTFVSNGGAHVARFMGQTLPAPPYTFTAKLSAHITTAFAQSGMILYEAGTGKWEVWGFSVNAGTYALSVGNSAGSLVFTSTATNSPAPPVLCLQINRTSTTLSFATSADCISYDILATRSITTDFTTAPDTIGMGGDPHGQAEVLNFNYFRRTL